MGIKEAVSNWLEKKKEQKEEFKRLERDDKFKRMLEDKKKSPMQKEHEMYEKEKERDKLKKIVDFERKTRAERMKKLSDPFSKNNNLFRERNDLMRGE